MKMTDTNTGGKYRGRTRSRFERIRYRLMWFFAPVKKKTIRHALNKEIETLDWDDWDNARMVGHLLGVWKDPYFERSLDVDSDNQ